MKLGFIRHMMNVLTVGLGKETLTEILHIFLLIIATPKEHADVYATAREIAKHINDATAHTS